MPITGLDVYKPMQEIVANIHDTVDIVNVIKPVFNFKASEAGWQKKAADSNIECL